MILQHKTDIVTKVVLDKDLIEDSEVLNLLERLEGLLPKKRPRLSNLEVLQSAIDYIQDLSQLLDQHKAQWHRL